nr:S-layer homology domain-containing protein [Acidaminobacter sp. JC074]
MDLSVTQSSATQESNSRDTNQLSLSENHFEDLNAGQGNRGLDYLVKQGILGYATETGYKLDGHKYITRAEAAVSAAIALAIAEPSANGAYPEFSDITDGWYENYIISIWQNKILLGKGQRTFDPTALITEQEVVTMVAKILEDYNTIESMYPQAEGTHYSKAPEAFIRDKNNFDNSNHVDLFLKNTGNKKVTSEDATRMFTMSLIGMIAEQKELNEDK